jgi:coenzyme F420-reducing hydrogenase alpha subunit
MLSHFVKRVRPMRSKTIKVDYLARVEGEGALYIRVKDGTVVDVKLKIFEPP